MSGDEKSIDRKLSTLSDRFGLRGRARASPNINVKSKPSLGLTPKRTFSPNIVSRSVKKEETPDKSHPQFKERRGRDRGHRGRGRGRGRGDNIIQSAGVFSQGIFSQPTLAKALGGDFSYRGGGGGGGGGSSGPSKILMKNESLDDDGDCIESGRVLEMMEDEGKLKVEDMKGSNHIPITLPLVSKMTSNIKQDDDIKNEPEKSDDDKAYYVRSAIKQPKVPPPIEIAELFKEDATDGQLLFFQFPDTLPIKPISSEDAPVKNEPGVETTAKADNKDTINEQSIEEHLKKFTFRNVSEGFIGKLCVHESGKVKMHLGNVSLDLTLGTPCGFLQDLISVQTDREPAEMISLGHINHRLIGVPDYKGLLGSVGT